MIKSIYGGPGADKVVKGHNGNQDFGQKIFYWKGGWRCQTTNGGAGCHNINHRFWVINSTTNNYSSG